MRNVSISYCNMWGSADAFPDNYLLDCFPYLRGHYSFTRSTNPEFVFYSVYGWVTTRFPAAKRLVFSGEPGDHFAYGAKLSPNNHEPGFYHYGITMEESTSPNHIFMPQGFLHLNLYNNGVQTLVRPEGNTPPAKDLFCNFIYSNGNSRRRIEFFEALSRYKRVESCGHVLRNNNALAGAAYSREGYLQKQAFQARCKFSIAFENTHTALYMTEKLTDPLVAQSVPIYWGADRVSEFFNPDAFVDASKFASDAELVAYIEYLDTHDEAYCDILSAPPFVGNKVPDALSDARYLQFWKHMLQ